MKIHVTKLKINLEKVFFTSDTHFFHKNIIKFCNRPFNNIEEHDEGLIERWNNKVPTNGTVFMLGDFAMSGQINYVTRLLQRLNGQIYWVLGNHDLQSKLDREVFKWHSTQADVMTLITDDPKLHNRNIFMSHYPHMYWPRDSYHIHGHVHSGPSSTARDIVPFHPNRYDVGVDNNNYEPISYVELRQIFLDNEGKQPE